MPSGADRTRTVEMRWPRQVTQSSTCSEIGGSLRSTDGDVSATRTKRSSKMIPPASRCDAALRHGAASQPIFIAVADALDQNVRAVGAVENHMRSVGVAARGWSQFGPRPCRVRVLCEECQHVDQPGVVASGLFE